VQSGQASKALVTCPASKGSHRRYTVGDHCSTTVSWHPGDIPDGTLSKIEEQLQHCLGSDWLRR
jgi:hypothetical protein